MITEYKKMSDAMTLAGGYCGEESNSSEMARMCLRISSTNLILV